MVQHRPAIPNPLAVALGVALRTARGRRPTQDVAKEIGIADSFYRLIESGRNHLSISKAPAIWRAFGGTLHYEAISMFLASIAASEDRKLVPGRRDGRGHCLHTNVSLICGALKDNHPFKSFLRRFLSPPRNVPPGVIPDEAMERSVLNLVDVPTVDIRQVVEMTGLAEDALDILCHFANYDPATSLAHNTYAQEFFGGVPSNYKPMFDGLRDSVRRLPRTFAPEESWEWEDLNQRGFRELIAICYAEPLTSIENLQNYQFDYLWSSEFQTAVFHILGGGDAEMIKDTFWTNLRTALAAHDNTQLLLQQADVVSAKTVFKPCDEATRQSLLNLFDRIESRNTREPPNAVWFFRTADQALVGAASLINSATKKSEWIRFLTFDECSSILSHVTRLMGEA